MIVKKYESKVNFTRISCIFRLHQLKFYFFTNPQCSKSGIKVKTKAKKNIKKDSKIVKIKNKWNDFEISTWLIPIKKEEIKYKTGSANGQMQIIQKI